MIGLNMNEKSAVEAVAGSTGVNLAVNAAPVLAQVFPAIGAMIDANAVPWLSALPFLLQTLAAGRQSARIDAAITALSADVARLQCDLTNITDDQYKLASECSLAFLSTINPAKLDYLRLAILNTLVDPSIADGASEALARLVRDISAAETALVIDLFSYEGVFIREKPADTPEGFWAVERGSPEELSVGDLIRLGLLHVLASPWNGTHYKWSPLTAKFIALVQAARPT
jgi:hypothetical protein